MTNTEKPTTKAEGKKENLGNKIGKIPTKQKLENAPQKKVEISKENKKIGDKKSKKEKSTKKIEAVVNGKGLPISTKKSVAICKFIMGKNIPKAILDLEEVLIHKKVVPMKGEIPHKKGKGIASGGYPKKGAENFIKLLKSLQANANANGLEEPIIVQAIANLASRPYGKFGRVKRKRTHVQIKVKEKKSTKKNKEAKNI